MGNPDPEYFDLAPAWARGMYKALIAHLNAEASALRHRLTTIRSREDKIMAQVQVDGDQLQSLTDNLNTIANDLEAELASLNVPQGDLAPVQAIVDRLRNDVVAQVPTPDPTPTPDPCTTPPDAPADPGAADPGTTPTAGRRR